MLLDRRTFCFCLSCTALSGPCWGGEAPAATCALSYDALASSVDKATISRLNGAKNDYANGLIIILSDLKPFLGVNFELFLYKDDPNYPNAAFTKDLTYQPPGSTIDGLDGVVLIGTNLIAETRAYFGGLGGPLTALCAHEAGHALQAKHGFADWSLYAGHPEDKFYQDRYELCADFICGYYGAHRVTIDKGYKPQTQPVTQFNKGDHKPIGHGTPEQRGNAVHAGYKFGRSGNHDSRKALEAGLEHVLSIDFSDN
jgi:hypothetical protein